MKIEHLALWVRDLEGMKGFYLKYFNGIPGEKYQNPKTGFESYFISFSEGGRLEIMRNSRAGRHESDNMGLGFAHVAFSLGSRQKVDELTEQLKRDGFKVLSGPRQTGDGYYESCILDPEGNQVEITV